MERSKDLLLASELRELTSRGDSRLLRHLYKTVHPANIAEFISAFPVQEAWDALRYAEPERRAEIFKHLDDELQLEIVNTIRLDEVAELFTYMSPDERADLFNKMPEGLRHAVFLALTKQHQEDIRHLTAYKEGTAGSVMTSEYIALSPYMTAQEATEYIRKVASGKEMIYYAYVVDNQGKLIGVVSLRDIITARPEARIGDIMFQDVIFAKVDDDQEDVARLFKKYDLLALPVVTDDGRLVGIVTVDDVLDIETEEATQDFQKMASMGLLKVRLKEASVFLLYRIRVGWLMALIFVNIFSGAGIAYFEETLASAISLAFFLPLLIGSGGNAGSQSATLMVRALATRDVSINDWVYILLKEFLVALLLGVTMATGVAVIAFFRSPEILPVVYLTMVCNVLFGSLLGASLPFILTKLKMDPATSSSPLIASIADIGGVLIYFNIAKFILCKG